MSRVCTGSYNQLPTSPGLVGEVQRGVQVAPGQTGQKEIYTDKNYLKISTKPGLVNKTRR